MSSVIAINKQISIPASSGTETTKTGSSDSISSFESLMDPNTPKEKPVLQTHSTAENNDKNMLDQVIKSLASLQDQKTNLQLGNNYLFKRNRVNPTNNSQETKGNDEVLDNTANSLTKMQNNSFLYQKHLSWTVKFNMISGIAESFKNSINKFLQM